MTSALLQELSVELGVSQVDLFRIIAHAPSRYKVYSIPKRSGGLRTIAHPSKELKIIQRYILANKLSQFPVHSAAAGYVRGKGIIDNARKHLGKEYLLKLDFVDFFPSIKVPDWERRARRFEIRGAELGLYNRILFWGRGGADPDCLSIGAPTSPMLSNIIMYDLDSQIQELADSAGLVYTRYADDITVSSDSLTRLLRCERAIERRIKMTKSPVLILNEEKRGLFGRDSKRIVTGLILTTENKVSIGRDRKRQISSMLHRLSIKLAEKNKLQPDAQKDNAIKQIGGLLAFANSVEPQFIESMRKKYGEAVIAFAMRRRSPN